MQPEGFFLCIYYIEKDNFVSITAEETEENTEIEAVKHRERKTAVSSGIGAGRL